MAKASGREWKMMSLGVGRLFLASILAKNTTILPQVEGATSPTSLDTSLGLPVAWSQGDRLSNLSRTSGSWTRCVCLPASSLGLGVRLAAAGSRTFPGGVRGSALWAWRSARKCEPRHWETDWGGRRGGSWRPLQPELCAAGVELQRTAGARWCGCQPADTGLAGQARPRKDGSGGHPTRRQWFRGSARRAAGWEPSPLVMPGT